jgi:hypothetical protein
MITPIQFDSGKTIKLPLAISQTVVKGDALVWASGYIAVAASTTEDVFAIAMEDVTTDGSSHTECLMLPVEGVRFEADCDAVVSIADRGTRCDLASKSTVNPDATTEKVFLIEEIVGEAEVSTKVIGRFGRFTAT